MISTVIKIKSNREAGVCAADFRAIPFCQATLKNTKQPQTVPRFASFCLSLHECAGPSFYDYLRSAFNRAKGNLFATYWKYYKFFIHSYGDGISGVFVVVWQMSKLKLIIL